MVVALDALKFLVLVLGDDLGFLRSHCWKSGEKMKICGARSSLERINFYRKYYTVYWCLTWLKIEWFLVGGREDSKTKILLVKWDMVSQYYERGGGSTFLKFVSKKQF